MCIIPHGKLISVLECNKTQPSRLIRRSGTIDDSKKSPDAGRLWGRTGALLRHVRVLRDTMLVRRDSLNTILGACDASTHEEEAEGGLTVNNGHSEVSLWT